MMTAIRTTSSIALVAALSACATGIPSASTPDPAAVVFEDFGVTSGSSGSNGLAFASGPNSHLTLDTTPMTMQVIRFARDPNTRVLEVFLTEETVTLAEYYMARTFGDATFTLGDTFWDTDNATAGVSVNLYKDIISKNIGEVRVFDDTGGVDEMFHHGYVVFGRETDPLEMPTGMSGSVTYSGRLALLGYPSIDGAIESEFNANIWGNMTMVLALADNSISGDFDLLYRWGAPDDDRTVSGIIAAAPVEGNGFSSTMQVTGCGGGHTCSGEGELGGVFYDADAAVLAGLAQLTLQIDGIPIYPTGTAQHDVQAIGFFDLDRQP